MNPVNITIVHVAYRESITCNLARNSEVLGLFLQLHFHVRDIFNFSFQHHNKTYSVLLNVNQLFPQNSICCDRGNSDKNLLVTRRNYQ